VHPLQFGLLRRRVRSQRRHGLPLESPLIFYPRRAWEFATNVAQWLTLLRRYYGLRRKVKTDPHAAAYVDEAMTPTKSDAMDHFVEVFADKIPNTHGAPPRKVAALT
jgi:hypothetical protein